MEILCQKNEKIAVTGFFEEMSKLMKQCDDCAEKERIKEILHNMNDTISYIVLGEEAVGKTSLLSALFPSIFNKEYQFDADICEYRYGEQEFVTQSISGFQKRFVVSEELKGLSLIDTKGLNHLNPSSLARLEECTAACEAIFVVLDVRRVNSPTLWDVIENLYNKRMLFFLTKCDLVSEAELAAGMDKVKRYMQEGNISAPIFAVSIAEEVQNSAITPFEEVGLYIRQQLIGVNPILTKQRQNIEDAREILLQLKESFRLRKLQYNSDAKILQKINQGLDSYVINQEKVIAGLVSRVTEEINKDIDDYQNEILSKMDPHKIRERFSDKEDFAAYLRMVNDNYKNILNESVNQKTVNAIKESLHELERIFENAVGYFNTRENILELNDRFYGSLSLGKKQMLADTRENVLVANDFYKTLSRASEEMFLQIWNERKKYDEKLHRESVLSQVSGGVAGIAGGTMVGKNVAALLIAALAPRAAIATIMSVTTIGGLVVIGTILGASTIEKIVKSVYEPRAGAHMENVAQKCMEQFKIEVKNAKGTMLEQVSSQITEIFNNELALVDGCFAEFRMSVNIDERNLPVIERNLEETEGLLRKIDAL